MFLGDILSLKFLLHQKEMGFLDLKSLFIGLDESADSEQTTLWFHSCSSIRDHLVARSEGGVKRP